MKLSVSLPSHDVEFIDAYAHDQGIASRSAVLHRAIRLLRATQLGEAYAAAWEQWSTEGEADAWETAVSDGLDRS